MSHKVITKNQLSKIDLKFLNQVNELKNLSVAEDKKVGAIIANHKTGVLLSLGYNKMFDDIGFQTCEDNDGQSLPYVIHAEESAVMEFLKRNNKKHKINDLTIYCSYSACINCAKLIQHAGIKRFVYSENYYKFKLKNNSADFLNKMNCEVIEVIESKKLIFNVGYIGDGIYNSKHKFYFIWQNILTRCYSPKYSYRPTYKGCTVDERWYNFQNFGKWYEENYVDGWHLDKDILIKGNKIYGPDTCCFVPHEINQLFAKSNSIRGKLPIGVCLNGKNYLARLKKYGNQINLGTYKTVNEAFAVYKYWKEKHISDLAYQYKNQIKDKVFKALINYKVEITD